MWQVHFCAAGVEVMKGEFTFGSHSILLIKIRVVRNINRAFGGHGVCG